MYAEPNLLLPFLEGFSLMPSPAAAVAQQQEHQLSMSLTGDLLGVSTPMVCFFPQESQNLHPRLVVLPPLPLLALLPLFLLFFPVRLSCGNWEDVEGGVSECAVKLDRYFGLAGPMNRSSQFFCKGNLVQPPTIFEYDLGGEGDLFKAPEPIIEETLLAIDPMSAAMSIMSCGDDVINHAIKVADIQTIQNEIQNNHLLIDVFYECKKDILEKYAINESVVEPTALQIPAMPIEEALSLENSTVVTEGPLNKSFSAGSLNIAEWSNGVGRLNFLEFKDLDFEAANGMRRAYSEGDIQELGNSTASFGGTNVVRSSLEQLVAMGDFKSEERRQKLSRYMKKKTKRNFGRTIKYACRKALADCQPRVRGRFARTEVYEISKQQK